MLFWEVPVGFLYLLCPLVGMKCIVLYGNSMHYQTSGANSCSLEKAPQVHNVWHPRVPQLVPFLGISTEALYSLENACYPHRAYYISFPPMGVTGTWLESPKRALNIICHLIKHFCMESIYCFGSRGITLENRH